jgi:hypothetical protein
MKNALKIVSAVIRTLAKDASLYNALISEVRPVLKEAFREAKQAIVESDLNSSSTELRKEFEALTKNGREGKMELLSEMLDFKSTLAMQFKKPSKTNGKKPTVVPPPADA